VSKLFKRTLVLLTILFGSIAFFTSFLASWNLYQHVSNEYQNRGKSIAINLSQMGAEHFQPVLSETTRGIIDQYMETKGVVYIIIRSANGSILYHTFNDQVPVELSQPAHTQKLLIQTRQIRDLGQVFEFIQPIRATGGAVEVGMDKDRVSALSIHTFISQQVVVFIMFILTIGFSYKLVKRISTPLQDLATYADEMSKSDFLHPTHSQRKIIRIAANGDDEVSQLAQSFIQLENQLLAYIKNLKETTSIKEKIESELNVARDIQMDMIPRDFSNFKSIKSIDIFSFIEPAKAVGGDFYDVIHPNRYDKLLFSIGDVSGKGTPAALYMAITTTLIKATAGQSYDPATILTSVNSKLCADNKSGLFVTVFIGVLDLKTGDLLYSVGGHNPPYIVSDGVVEAIGTHPGLPLGIDAEADYTTERIKMAPDSLLYLFTDGVTESRDSDGEFFKESSIEKLLSQHGHLGSKEVCDKIIQDLTIFSRGAAQSDDITMMALRWTPGNT